MSFKSLMSFVLAFSVLLGTTAQAQVQATPVMVTENNQGTLTYKKCAWSGRSQDIPTGCQTVGFIKPDDIQALDNRLQQDDSAASDSAMCSYDEVVEALDKDSTKITLLALSGGAVGAILGPMLVPSLGADVTVGSFAGYVTRLTLVIAGLSVAAAGAMSYETGVLKPCSQIHSVVLMVLHRLYEDSLRKVPEGYLRIQVVPEGYWTFLGNGPIYHSP